MVGFIRKEAVSPSAIIFKSKYDKRLVSEGDLVYLRKENENNFCSTPCVRLFRLQRAPLLHIIR
jgi:hypothetical protein